MRVEERPKSLLVASLKKPALAIPAIPPAYSPKTTAAVNAVVAIRLSRRRTHDGVAPNKYSLCWPQSPLRDSAQVQAAGLPNLAQTIDYLPCLRPA
jgi:hypothetical protein